ncbi:MAG: metal-dependent hydrolase [Candidatus Kapaibacterium sp.]|nr:metal-dependent hydrolase [Bacteroidota bacterium]
MASIITHAIASSTVGTAVFGTTKQPMWFWIITAILGMLPDADVITFKFGVKYADMLGHRGFFHSLLWCSITGILTAFLYRKIIKQEISLLRYSAFFAFAMSTHPILDALTTGGLGIAFFSPFDTTRYFFPWHVIVVSPIGIKEFFGTWGIKVILSEIVWVWVPCAFIFTIQNVARKRFPL